MPRIQKILIVDDDDELRGMLVEYLASQTYSILGTRSIADGHAAVKRETFDLVMCDLRLHDGSGLDLLRTVRQVSPQSSCILMTGFASMETAVEAIHVGVFEYLIKPIVPAQLSLVLQRLESIRRLESENTYLRQQQLNVTNGGAGVVWGQSRLMQDILEMVKKVAQTHVSVLIQGESGTGKEVIANAIVEHSPRAHLPFIKINCAALPEAQLEAELFGLERSGSNGSSHRREGRLETANGGTLLLDEIAEIPLALQAKLMRVLQDREFQRVGGDKMIPVDVRIVASTNRDLHEAVRQGHFREDLFYRLNVVPIYLPPLRLRGEDLEGLITHFVGQIARKHGKAAQAVTPQSLERLRAYHWPGNVRELQNTLERAIILAEDEKEIEIQEFNASRQNGSDPLHVAGALPTVSEMERRLIACMLLQTNHNKTRAAQRLGISLRTLRNKLRIYRSSGLDTARPATWAE